MTVEGHNTCKNLRLNTNGGNNEHNKNDDDLYEKRRMKFKRRNRNVNHEYGNCNFILGSSAVFERLWLMANKLLYGIGSEHLHY